MVNARKISQPLAALAILAIASLPISAVRAQGMPSGMPMPGTAPAPLPGPAPLMMQGQGQGMPMQGSGGMMGMMDNMSMMQMMAGRTEGRLAFLKAELAITAAQQQQWNAYENAVRNDAKGRGAAMPMMSMGQGAAMPMGMGQGAAMPMMGMGQAQKPVTWPDRLTQQEQDLEKKLASVRGMKAASSALYAVLSDAQKKTADELMAGPMGHM